VSRLRDLAVREGPSVTKPPANKEMRFRRALFTPMLGRTAAELSARYTDRPSSAPNYS